MNNEFDINVNLKETGSSELTANAEKALSQIQKALGLVGKVTETYEKSMNTLLSNMAKQVSNANQETRLLARQTAREQSMARGGYDAAGRLRNVNASAQMADVKNITEVLSAQMANTFKTVLSNVAKSIESAAVTEFAKTRQSLLSTDAATAKAQIEAQRARVGFAAASVGPNSQGSIRQATALGITGLGDLKAEQAALDRLLTSQQQITSQLKAQVAEERTFAGLNRQINNLTDERITQTKEYITSLKLAQQIAREEINLQNKRVLGDRTSVLAQEQKLAGLKLRQMALVNVDQESKSYREQLDILKRIADERAEIVTLNKQAAVAAGEEVRLQRSKDFAAGTGVQSEIVKNNILGSRRVAMSDEGRASLLALQAGLSVNYALIGGVSTAVSSSIESIVEYDRELRELQAIAGATEKEFNNLSESILNVSKSTKFSAVELADAATQFAQAGLSVDQINSVLKQAADFASATGSDLKTTVDLLTTTMNVFQVDSSQVSTVLNVFTAALNTSKLSIDQLSAAFQYTANIAADSGVTYQELTAVIASMAQAGIKAGSMIGTGLRQAFAEFAAPSEKLVVLLGQLGLSMEDVNVQSQGVVGVLTNLREAGLTAEQAMAVFEKRTASAVIAAVNQSKFTEELTRNIILSTAAETAAAKSKESLVAEGSQLRNNLLAIVNDAARPYIDALGEIAKALTAIGSLQGPLSAVLGVMAAFAGATIIASLVKLTGELIKFSGVMSAIGPIITATLAPFKMLALGVAAFGIELAATRSVTTAFTVALAEMRVAMLALNINPVILALTALIATVWAVSAAVDASKKSFEDYEKVIDTQQSAVNANTAQLQQYETISNQVDQTIQRLIDRHSSLTKGQDDTRNATQALSNLTLEAALSFNSMGASIDATGESFNSIMLKMQNFSIRIKQLQADVLTSSAAMNRSLAINQRGAASAGLNQNTFSMGALRVQLRAMGIDGKTADQIVGDASWLQGRAAGGGANLNANDAIAAQRLQRQVADLIPKTSGLRSDLVGNPLNSLTSNLSALTQNITGALSSESNASMLEMQASSARVAADPKYQKRLREAGYDPTSVSDSRSFFADRSRTIEQDYQKSGDARAYNAARLRLNADMDAAFQRGEQTLNNLDNMIRSAGSVGEADRLSQDRQSLNERQQQLATVLRSSASARDNRDKEALPGVVQQLKNGRSDLARQSLRDLGYDPGNMSASELESFATRQLGYAKRGARSIQYGNRLNPDQILGIDIEERTNLASQSARGARAGAGADRAAQRTSQDTLKLAEDAASVLLSTAKNAMRQITTDLSANILKGTTSADARAQIQDASEAFKNVQSTTTKAYNDQIAAINSYIAERGDKLPAEQVNSLREKIESLEVKRDQELEANLSKFETAINKVQDRLPQLFKPITTAFTVLDRILSGIQQKFRGAQDVLALMENTQGQMNSMAENDPNGSLNAAVYAITARNRRALMGARSQAAAAQQQQNQESLAASSLALDRLIMSPSGSPVNLRSIGTGQNFERYLQQQRELLAGMEKGSVEAAAQARWIADIEGSQQKIVELVNQEATLRAQTTAYSEAQAQLEKQRSQPFGTQAGQAVGAWAENNGLNNQNIAQSALNGIPQVLDSAKSGFTDFFSTIIMGTESVGDAWKTLGRTIIGTMAQIVASEAAKALMKLAIKVIGSFFGANTGGPVTKNSGGRIHLAGGGGIDSFASLAGTVAGGTPGRDSVDASLTPGEYVLRKSAVDLVGEDALNQINFNGNRVLSKNTSTSSIQTGMTVQQPFNVYVVSPEQQPPPSKKDVIIAVRDDIINRGPVFKSIKAAQQGAF